jgi:hypothetical protein
MSAKVAINAKPGRRRTRESESLMLPLSRGGSFLAEKSEIFFRNRLAENFLKKFRENLDAAA